MLAATSNDRDQSPAPFHVALRIISSERHLPEKLSEHLRKVVAEAIRIVRDPTTIDANTLPEAIQLAFDLQQSSPLREALESVQDGQISPATAKDILAAERRFAAPR